MVHRVGGTYGFNRFRPSDVLWWRTRALDVVTGKSKAPFSVYKARGMLPTTLCGWSCWPLRRPMRQGTLSSPL